MATIAAALPRAHAGRRVRPALLAGALCAASAALYGWMRAPLGYAQADAFHEMCARIRMSPTDWPCATNVASTVAAQVGAAVVTWLAVALPGALLAASGRRLTWAIPTGLAAAGALVATWLSPNGWSQRLFGVMSSPIGSGEPRGAFWFSHTTSAIVADLVLVGVPAVAIAFIVRPPRRPSAEAPKRHASWVATFGVVGAIVALRLLWPHLPIGEYVVVSGMVDTIAVGFIALFAAMLGTGRRWWPWSLVPVAVLLSLGPTMAVAGIPSRLTVLSWFANVVPLATVGFVASLWRPIAMRLSGRRPRPERRARTSVRVRPIVLVNAIAVGMLAVSLAAVRGDPVGWQIATPLPTYLGARDLAFDARTEMNLLEATAAIERYRDVHGTLASFDAEAGEAVAPGLRWLDRTRHVPLVVSVVGTGDSAVTVVALSATGSLYCARAGRETPTFGSVDPLVGSAPSTLLERALAACGDAPLTAAAIPTIDVVGMCEGADDEAIVVCRSVQRRIVAPALASPTLAEYRAATTAA